MSLLPWWELPWLEDLEDEDDSPPLPAEVLMLTAAGGWWSASLVLPDLD